MARRNLTTDEQRQVTQQTSVEGLGALLAEHGQAGYLRRYKPTVNPAALAAASILASTANQNALDLTTGFSQPDVPRNISAAIAASTAAHVAAVSVTITGTNILGQEISEVLPAFTADTPGSVAGNKAFKTITRIQAPAHDGNTALLTIGYGDKLGVDHLLFRNTVLLATLAGVFETTRPTVTTSSTAIESCTVDLNSALNGTEVAIYFIAERD